MRRLMRNLMGLIAGNRGQGMVEYALILALVSIIVIIVLIATGNQFKNLYSDIVVSMNGAGL